MILENLLLLATVLYAESTVQPCPYAKTLYQNISSSATASAFIQNGDVCTINWTNNPAKPIEFFDENAERKAIMLELQTLLKKTEDGKSDVKDKDRILVLLIRWVSL